MYNCGHISASRFLSERPMYLKLLGPGCAIVKLHKANAMTGQKNAIREFAVMVTQQPFLPKTGRLN